MAQLKKGTPWQKDTFRLNVVVKWKFSNSEGGKLLCHNHQPFFGDIFYSHIVFFLSFSDDTLYNCTKITYCEEQRSTNVEKHIVMESVNKTVAECFACLLR